MLPLGIGKGNIKMPRRKRTTGPKTPLSEFIRDLRQKRGLSLKEIAALAECAPSTVHAWSTGSMPCESFSNVKKLCDKVGLPFETAILEQKRVTTEQIGRPPLTA